MSLQKKLEALITNHSTENESDTPDYILASYITGCLVAFNRAVNQREVWYGLKTQKSEESVKSPASPVQHQQGIIVLKEKVAKIVHETIEAYGTSDQVAENVLNFIFDPCTIEQSVPSCECVVKESGIKGMFIIFPRRECPVHGKLWQP